MSRLPRLYIVIARENMGRFIVMRAYNSKAIAEKWAEKCNDSADRENLCATYYVAEVELHKREYTKKAPMAKLGKRKRLKISQP